MGEKYGEIVARFREVMSHVFDCLFEPLQGFVKLIDGFIIDIAPVSGRVKHLARHAKKYRTRKKNRNRIRRAMDKEKRNARLSAKEE
ncbi:MAG: hypothetical protein IJ236_06745 [Oscillospiraceae bacterium]|nr:hypothetical protein [Oscillospiraceae bacterium]MBQ9643869.1 hypothetical protein [Lachnospiraceae bacterium]